MLYKSNHSRTAIHLIRPHQCDSEGGRIRGVLLYLQSTLQFYSFFVLYYFYEYSVTFR